VDDAFRVNEAEGREQVEGHLSWGTGTCHDRPTLGTAKQRL
jgi:hypothetical protein